MTRFNALFAAAAVLAMAAAPLPALAQAAKIATGNDYPPFTHKDLPDGGIAAKLVTATFKEMGTELDLQWLPWARQFDQAKNGELLGTFPWTDKDDRKDHFLFSDPLFEIKDMIWVPEDSAEAVAKPEDLAGKKPCLPNGYGVPGELKALVEGGKIELERPTDMTTCFKLMQAGRVAMVIAIVAQGEATAKEVFGDVAAVKQLDFGAKANTLHLLFSKKHADAAATHAKFNAALAKAKAAK